MQITNITEILTFTEQVAAQAGQLVKQISERGSLIINQKSKGDLVTEADLASENLIIKAIKDLFPEHSFLSEETNPSADKLGNNLWIIDPIDGTTNFSRQIPLCGVSIAYALNKEVLVGVVYNPFSNEMFSAAKGRGAFLNGKQIRPTEVNKLENAIVAVGTSSPTKRRQFNESITRQIFNILKETQDVRRLGAAAIDLCMVACGRLDGFYEPILCPWDVAAAKLIAKEAGASCGFLKESPLNNLGEDISCHEIIAAAPGIYEELRQLLLR